MVQVNISARHGHLAPETQERITEKVERLARFFDRITGIQVVVDLEDRETPVVELCASVEHAENFIATDRGELVSTLDRVIHKIEEQLRRHKKKITGHRATSHKHLEVPDEPQAESE